MRVWRFQSSAPNGRGRFPGVFALANGLSASGRLSRADVRWLVTANRLLTAAYADPTAVSPDCYDPVANAGAMAWFKDSATELLAMTAGHLELLDRYGVGWVELCTSDPGRLTHEDDVQVVAVPFSHSRGGPLWP